MVDRQSIVSDKQAAKWFAQDLDLNISIIIEKMHAIRKCLDRVTETRGSANHISEFSKVIQLIKK